MIKEKKTRHIYIFISCLLLCFLIFKFIFLSICYTCYLYWKLRTFLKRAKDNLKEFFFFYKNPKELKGIVYRWVVIFEQLFWYNFSDNLVVLSFHWSKQIEREKRRERIEDNVSMREKIVQKLYKNSCTNIISVYRYIIKWTFLITHYSVKFKSNHTLFRADHGTYCSKWYMSKSYFKIPTKIKLSLKKIKQNLT